MNGGFYFVAAMISLGVVVTAIVYGLVDAIERIRAIWTDRS